MFDIDKAKASGKFDAKTVSILEKINENTRKRESCKGHDFETSSFGKHKCKNCGCEEDIKYVVGYNDGMKHSRRKDIT